MPSPCKTSGCPKEASYGLESDRKRISCAGHKDDEYINLIAKKCKTSGCPKEASFGLESDRKRISCAGHKDDDHVHLHGNKCKCGQFFVARKGDSCATCNPSSNPSSLWYNLKCNLTLYILNLIGLTNLSEVWFSRDDSLCKGESERKSGRIDGLLISNSANNSNSIWSFECNEFHHERNEVECDSGRYLANVLNYMKVYKERDGSFPSLIHLYFNPDLGHSRSEATNESNEARSTFLTKNIINLLKSISYIEKQKHQPSNCYIYFINYEQTYYDNYNNVEKNAKCIKLVNETIENEDLYTNELKNVLCQNDEEKKKKELSTLLYDELIKRVNHMKTSKVQEKVEKLKKQGFENAGTDTSIKIKKHWQNAAIEYPILNQKNIKTYDEPNYMKQMTNFKIFCAETSEEVGEKTKFLWKCCKSRSRKPHHHYIEIPPSEIPPSEIPPSEKTKVKKTKVKKTKVKKTKVKKRKRGE